MSTNKTNFNIDDEEVFASIFTQKFSEEQVSSPHFLPYLSHLCSSDLTKLNREPERLKNEKMSLLQQTCDLAFHNYKTFISTADCSKGIVNDFSVIEDKLQHMRSTLPLLSEHGQNFLKQVSKLGSTRLHTSLTLQKNTELLEILEIPQLMNTCVRNQYFDDALELIFYVKRISKKQTLSSIPVVAGIINDVKQSAALMLEQLLNQLRSQIQLPECLKIVGYLRRLECFTETELRFKFLQVRNTWLESKIPEMIDEDASESKAYDYLTNLLETYRVNLFNIVTQYRGVFTADSSVFPHNLVDADSAPHPDGLAHESAILSSWITYRISYILKVLRIFLKRIPDRLDSILAKSMYFGYSFGRVGADFRCLLVNAFNDTIEEFLTDELDSLMTNFDSLMISHSLISSVSYSQTIGNVSNEMTSSSSKTPIPPPSLMQHQPICVYVNGIISLFNNLRICCPISLSVWLANQMSNHLDKAAAILVAFHETENAAFSKIENKTFNSLCKSFLDDAIPHIKECFTTLFTEQSFTDIYGPLTFTSAEKGFPKIKLSEIMQKVEEIALQKE